MIHSRTRGSLAAVVVAVPVLLTSCTEKKAPPPPVAQQAPPTAAPATTLPPPPPPSPTPVPTPPPVWRTVRWGMTAKEVLAALPDEAKRLPKPAGFAKPQPGSSLAEGSSDVSMPAYDADGATFRVLFGFGASGLERIHLDARKPGTTTCGALEKALTERHSAPSQRSTTGTSLRGEEIVWKRPDQTIVLSCSGVASLGFVTVTLDHLAPGRDQAK
jgi:hypothetical protein